MEPVTYCCVEPVTYCCVEHVTYCCVEHVTYRSHAQGYQCVEPVTYRSQAQGVLRAQVFERSCEVFSANAPDVLGRRRTATWMSQ